MKTQSDTKKRSGKKARGKLTVKSGESSAVTVGTEAGQGASKRPRRKPSGKAARKRTRKSEQRQKELEAGPVVVDTAPKELAEKSVRASSPAATGEPANNTRSIETVEGPSDGIENGRGLAVCPVPVTPQISEPLPRIRVFKRAACSGCGWHCALGERYARPDAPVEISCPACNAPVRNTWLAGVNEPEEHRDPDAAIAFERMQRSGRIRFWLSNPNQIIFNFLNEPDAVRNARSRIHEQWLRAFSSPLGLLLAGLLLLTSFVMVQPVTPQPLVAVKPIEYVPEGLDAGVERARITVLRYLSAATAAEKHAVVLPGVSEEDIARYLQAGGRDPVLDRENVVFSTRHSDIARHWYSFTLTPPGSLREIRTYVSMAGPEPALHWPAYVQEKDGTAIEIAAATTPGSHDLHVGVCRAASLEGKLRVVLLGLDGTVLCYAGLGVENSVEVHSRLDYERPESATVQLTTLPDGSKCVTQWKSWGLERRGTDLAAAAHSGTSVISPAGQ